MAYPPEFQLRYFAILGGHYLRDGRAQDAENYLSGQFGVTDSGFDVEFIISVTTWVLLTSQNGRLEGVTMRAGGIAPTSRPHPIRKICNMPIIQVSGCSTTPTSNYRHLSVYMTERGGPKRGSGDKNTKNAPIEVAKKPCGTIARITRLSPLLLAYIIFIQVKFRFWISASFYFFRIFENLLFGHF